MSTYTFFLKFWNIFIKKLNTANHIIKRNKIVTVKILTLTFAFIVLWLPVHLMATLYRLDINFPKTIHFYVFKIVAHTMSYSATLVSPTIYIFSNNFESSSIDVLPIRYNTANWKNLSKIHIRSERYTGRKRYFIL